MSVETSAKVNKMLKFMAGGAVISAGLIAPNLVKLLEPLIKKNENIDTELQRLLRHMRRMNLISVEQLNDGNKYVSLTKAGEERLKYSALSDIQIQHPDTWDGKWHVATFDIPRIKKSERYELLTQFHRLGLQKVLQSMWVYPFAFEKEVMEISSVLGIKGDMVFMKAQLDKEHHAKLLTTFKDLLKTTKQK